MQTISDFPYFEVQFNKEGAIHDDTEAKQIMDFFSEGKVSDLFVISHGWNNDMAEARKLYKAFFSHVRAEINKQRPAGIGARAFAVLGILWPSKKFADEELIPSGAAGIGLSIGEEEEIKEELESLKGVFDNPDADAKLDRAKQLVSQVDTNDNAATELIDLIRSLPHKQEVHPDDGSDEFFNASSATLLDILSRPDLPVSSGEDTGAAAGFDSSLTISDQGEAAGFNFFGGIISAISKVLNFTTYYQMKARAGVVGQKGAYQLLTQVRKNHPAIKLHLIGHSFGGRLVTSIANGPDGGAPIKPESMTLLQAAFSHNGFANKFDGTRDGFFRKVVTENRMGGPIIITHNIKDTAVGKAYPIASKLSGDDAASFGGPDSPFGGIGRNGSQHTPEADNSFPLSPVTSTYTFQPGKIYNLKADTIILDHSDIAKPEVAHALLSAVLST